MKCFKTVSAEEVEKIKEADKYVDQAREEAVAFARKWINDISFIGNHRYEQLKAKDREEMIRDLAIEFLQDTINWIEVVYEREKGEMTRGENEVN